MFCPQMLEEFVISTNDKSIFTWVRNLKADAIFLNETFSTPDVFDSWKFQWRGDMY